MWNSTFVNENSGSLRPRPSVSQHPTRSFTGCRRRLHHHAQFFGFRGTSASSVSTELASNQEPRWRLPQSVGCVLLGTFAICGRRRMVGR